MNGLNFGDNIDDAILTNGGVNFNSPSYIQVSSITAPHVSQTIAFEILLLSLEPSVVFRDSNVVLELMNPFIRLHYSDQVIEGCFDKISSINERYLIAIAVNYISTSQINIAVFIDTTMCIHTQITSSFQPFTDLKLGQGFKGLFTRFTTFKAVMGVESFSSYQKSTCPPAHYFDMNSYQCVSCDSECLSCYSSQNTECIEFCPTGTYFYENQCRTCHPTCLECMSSDSTYCTVCRPGLTLQADNTCVCDPGFFFQTYSLSCQMCNLGCQTCQNGSSICTSCETGYTLNQYQDCLCPNSLVYNGNSCQCIQIGSDGACKPCGDGIIELGQECDDGNDFNGDGCSEACTIQPLFQCNPQIVPSICQPMEFISIQEVFQEANEQGITIILRLNSRVYVQNFTKQNLTIIHDFSQQPTISVEQIKHQELTELKFTINPLESIPPFTKTIGFTIQSYGMQTEDNHFIVPQILTHTIPVTEFDYINPSIQTVSQSFDHSMSSFTTASVIGGIIGQILLQVSLTLSNMSIEPLWVLINTNQLIYMMPLISVNFPLNSIVLFKVLSFANGDLLLFVIIYRSTVGKYISQSDSGPYMQNFAVLGYQTMGLFDNAGIFYCLLLFQVFFLICVFLFSKICCGNLALHCTKCVNKLCGSLIRTYYEVLLEIMLCSCITIYDMNLSSYTAQLSYALACLSVMIGLIITNKLVSITIRSVSELSNENSKVYQKYNEVFRMLRMDGGFYPLQYFSWFTIRRLMVIVVLLFLVRLPLIQIILHMLFSVLDLVFLSVCKPFREKIDLIFNILNTLALILLYFIVLLIFILEDNYSSRQALGWSMIVLIIILNVANMVSILSIKICETKNKCKRRKSKIKKKYKMRKERCDDSYQNSASPSILRNTFLESVSHNSNKRGSLFKRLRFPSLRRETSQVEQQLREVK